jgi:uncharacterized repeat protein (TIGR01451 family)/MYXO-CTERM domain-containing protein
MKTRGGSALGCGVAIACALYGSNARAETVTFDTGALIIPMDVDYQDSGMLKAFGLLDKLLRAGVPVQWVIKTPKIVVDAAKGKFEDDFTASAKDYKTSAVITAHGYRGGPFVIAAADADKAKPIITAWQASNTTAVHVTTAPFSGNVSRRLTAAPRIAVFADGSQNIAFSYLNAAGIPDNGGVAWTAASADVVTPAEVMGPTITNHSDGILFRKSGQPAYCEIMTMHWKVNEPEAAEVTAELTQFLKFPVHVNAECQAVNAIEGEPPVGGRAKFVASKGFAWPAPSQPASVDFLNSALPFAQMDGPFKTTGGSEPAYALAPGSTYYDTGIVMVKGAGKAIGVQDVWMTGYANSGAGTCPITDPQCVKGGAALGKVSYLGGHSYETKVPISLNGETQGTRLFLNSLYEAGCVTDEGQPKITLDKVGPAITTTDTITYSLSVVNTGLGPALDLNITDVIPTGATFVSATKGGTFAAGTVTWTIGDLAKGATDLVDVTIKLPTFGTYNNSGKATFLVGLTTMTASSGTVSTTYVDCAGDAASSCACSDSATCVEAGVDTGAADTAIAMADSAVDATEDAAGGETMTAADSSTADSSGDDSSVTDTATVADTSTTTEDTGSTAADSTIGTDSDLTTDTGSGDPTADADPGSTGGCGCSVPRKENNAAWLALALALALLRRKHR